MKQGCGQVTEEYRSPVLEDLKNYTTLNHPLKTGLLKGLLQELKTKKV